MQPSLGERVLSDRPCHVERVPTHATDGAESHGAQQHCCWDSPINAAGYRQVDGHDCDCARQCFFPQSATGSPHGATLSLRKPIVRQIKLFKKQWARMSGTRSTSKTPQGHVSRRGMCVHPFELTVQRAIDCDTQCSTETTDTTYTSHPKGTWPLPHMTTPSRAVAHSGLLSAPHGSTYGERRSIAPAQQEWVLGPQRRSPPHGLSRCTPARPGPQSWSQYPTHRLQGRSPGP